MRLWRIRRLPGVGEGPGQHFDAFGGKDPHMLGVQPVLADVC